MQRGTLIIEMGGKGGLWDHQVVCVSLFNVCIKSPSFAKYVTTLRQCRPHYSSIRVSN